MKVKLTPGAELDLLTADELRSIVKETKSGWRRPPLTVRPTQSVGLDSNGDAHGTIHGAVLFEVPAGYSFLLHRLTVKPDGYTFGVPYTSATGYLDIVVSELMRDGIPFAAPGLPRVYTVGFSDGIFCNNGEVIRIDIHGGPANGVINLRGQGTLQPIIEE